MHTLHRTTAAYVGTALLVLALAFAGSANSQSSGKNGDAKKAGASQSKGDVEKGRVVYKRNCEICHHSASTAKKIGPGLKAIYKSKTFADGKPVNDDTMRVWIEDGGKDMPQFKNTLKPQQIEDLIAYMRTL